MKKFMMAMLLLLASVNLYSQSNNKNIFDSWPELKTFHGVMSQTFHPAEEGNLEPIKTRVAEFNTKAIALSASKIPADLNTEKVKTAVAELKEGAAKMQKMIDEKASDEAITKHLTYLHDVFHRIVGLCVHGEGEKH